MYLLLPHPEYWELQAYITTPATDVFYSSKNLETIENQLYPNEILCIL
jgi:hypothetical protein